MADLELNRGGGCPPEEESEEAFQERMETEAAVRALQEEAVQKTELVRKFGDPKELEQRAGDSLLKAAQLTGSGAAGMSFGNRFDAAAYSANAQFFAMQSRRARGGS